MTANATYINQEFKNNFKGWTLEFLQFMHNVKREYIPQETQEAIDKKFLASCANKLRRTKAVQFVYGDLFYDIFKSFTEMGYIINVYPNDKEKIFDAGGELIDDEQLDGGCCTGSAKDAVYFMIGDDQ